MANRIRLGDVIEIVTSKGFAYAQFSHKHVRYGALLRVLPGLFADRPIQLLELVAQQERFFTFFPLQAAINKELLTVVVNCPIPKSAQAFPLFRTGVEDPTTGKVKMWWLWDGDREWKVGEITQEQRKLSLRGIWNDTLLIERIEEGWTPANDRG